MDVPQAPDDDVLAYPVRRRLFATLTELRRPSTTQELADLVGRHPNSVRAQLDVLASAGLVERRWARQPRGRPRHEWGIAADAKPAGDPPQAHGQLSQWLARALARGTTDLEAIERTGREIGRELARETGTTDETVAMRDALTALGFAPQVEGTDGGTRFVLRNCPYRDAVRENPAAICTLHRGMTAGLLDKLSRGGVLDDFVARDPYEAGCLIDVSYTRPKQFSQRAGRNP